jgi:putative ATP-binding cassette transporter
MVRLLKLILPFTGRWSFVGIVLLSILSGLSGFFYINLTTRVIKLISSGGYTTISKEYLSLFIGSIVLIIAVRRILSMAIIRMSQRTFWQLRKQILSVVLKANYSQLRNRKDTIHSSVLGDVYVLTDAAMSIIGFSTALILCLSCFVYLASISIWLFLITLGVAVAGVGIYYWGAKKYNGLFHMARVKENKFVESLNTILNGFKEIYMEPKIGKYIYENRISKVSDETYKYTTGAQVGYLNNQIIGQILFYILVASVLLIFSVTMKIDFSNTVSFVFALFYLLGSIETIMVLLPGLSRAKVSVNHLLDLIGELEGAGFNNQLPDHYVTKDEFHNIAIRGLEYAYDAPKGGFSIGPVDMDIDRGKVIFIFGENGSGKTTLVHSILGLCIPRKGKIFFNGVPVDKFSYPNYRTAFSVVFSDFFLFNELLAVEEPDIEKWNYYIRLFEMEGKVTLDDKRFSTTNLSTGQRKRLALIAALLEEKPILVIDEWAADQDPYFRKKFYTEIIPMLKEEGITIIAVTHDDKYYHCADDVYKMDYGKLVWQDCKNPLMMSEEKDFM